MINSIAFTSKPNYEQLNIKETLPKIKKEPIIDTKIKLISGSILCFCVSRLVKNNTIQLKSPLKQTMGTTKSAKLCTNKTSIATKRILLQTVILMVWLMRLNSTRSGERANVHTTYKERMTRMLQKGPLMQRLTISAAAATAKNGQRTIESILFLSRGPLVIFG